VICVGAYPVMTRSAERGILETTSWKPAVAWHVERILLLKEIKFIAFRRNEVNSKARAPRANAIEHYEFVRFPSWAYPGEEQG